VFRRRYRRIVGFFARIVAGLLFWEWLLPHLGMRKRAERTRPERLSRIAARFRSLAVEMGGVMIKLGQFLSSRLDVLPIEITAQLAALQDDVPEESFADIRALLEAELDASIETLFEAFDPVPMAAASLGQVHKARLCPPPGREGGQAQKESRVAAAADQSVDLKGTSPSEDASVTDASATDASVADASVADVPAAEAALCEVIVKVQRPNIESIIAVDLAALRTVARWMARYPPIRKRADVDALLGEFSRVTYQEIDYLAEGRNAETFAANFAGRPGVRIPRVHWPLTTRRVLTLEDVEGIKITDFAAIEEAGIDRVEVAQRLFDCYLQQIFEDGFFHADPHPGNLFVGPSVPGTLAGSDTPVGTDGRWTLTFVDFGMVGHVPPRIQGGLREMFLGVATRDAGRMVGAFQALGMLLPGADLELLEKAQARMLEQAWGRSLAEMQGMSPQEMEAMLYEFRELFYDMPFQIPEDFIFLGRTVGILSGMCTGLDPGFNPWTSLQPYAQKLMSGGGLGASLWDELRRLGGSLLRLPGRVDSLLGRLERSELEVRTPQLEKRLDRLERRIYRSAWAVVLMALCLGGTQFLLSGWEALGSILLGAAGVLLVWLLLAG
jgi:predicted unusual protein kinase regulating ubiquinone biosynthesis (AarF/ABC1/UbiB family)